MSRAAKSTKTKLPTGIKLSVDEIKMLEEFEDRRKEEIAKFQADEEKGEEAEEYLVADDEDDFPADQCLSEGFGGITLVDGNLKVDKRANFCLHHFDDWFESLFQFIDKVEIDGKEILENEYEAIEQEFTVSAIVIRMKFIPIPPANVANQKQLTELYEKYINWSVTISPTVGHLLVSQKFVDFKTKRAKYSQGGLDEETFTELNQWLKSFYNLGFNVLFTYELEFPLPEPPKRFLDDEELKTMPVEIVINSVVGTYSEETESKEAAEGEEEGEVEEEELVETEEISETLFTGVLFDAEVLAINRAVARIQLMTYPS